MFQNNLLALGITMLIALAWLRINDFFAHRGWIDSALSRKIIHIGTGPIFVLCWLLFNEAPIAPYLAAIVPLGITLQFALVGTGIIKDPASVEAMSRTGDRREILRGPLFYGVAFVVLTLVFWRRTPVGMVALMILCGGDGLADIVGNRVRGMRLPWSKKKTVSGSLTMFIGGFLFPIMILWIFVHQGFFGGGIGDYVLSVAIIAAVCALIESLPYSDIDNITVPVTAVILGFFLF